MEIEYSREDISRKAADVHIRPATEADSATIHRMVRAEHLDPTAIKWQNFLVAEKDGQIVGIGQIRQHADCQELGSLVVLLDYRRRGVAAALIEALTARAGRPLYLFCRDRMAPYYEQFGFARIGYWQAPRSLRLKILIPMAFRLFGIRIVIMRKV